jgi:hypothetical protein
MRFSSALTFVSFVLIAVLPQQGFAQNIDLVDVVAAWLFEEGDGDVVLDSSLNGNDGTLVNGFAWEEAGKFGTAITFDGRNNSSMRASTVGFPTGDEDRTIAFWVKSPNFMIGETMLAAWGASANGKMSAVVLGLFRNPEGVLGFWGYNDDVGHPPPPPEDAPRLVNDEWHHVAVTYSARDAIIYLNGNVWAQGRVPFPLTTPADSDFWLSDWKDTMLPFQGSFDDVVVLAVALCQDDVASLMDDGLAEVFGGPPFRVTCSTTVEGTIVGEAVGACSSVVDLFVDDVAVGPALVVDGRFEKPIPADCSLGVHTLKVVCQGEGASQAECDFECGLSVACTVTEARAISVQTSISESGGACASVDLMIDGVPAGSATVPGDGIFEIPLPSPCSAGEHTLTVVCMGSGLSATCTFICDNVDPEIICGDIDPGDFVAAWLFEEDEGIDVEDASDNGNDGLLTFDAETAWEDGMFGTALHFNGGEESMTAFTDGFPVGADDRTLAFWLKSDNAAQSERFLAGWGSDATSNMSAIFLGLQSMPSRQFSFWGFNNDLEGITELQDSTWYHIAFTLEGETTTLYLNGEVESQDVLAPLDTPADTPFWVAKFPGLQGFQGTFDEMVVLGVALDQASIKTLMQGVQGLLGGPVCPSNLRCNLRDANVEVRWCTGRQLDSLQLVINGGAPMDLDTPSNAVDIPIGDLNQEGDNTIELRATPGCATLSCRVQVVTSGRFRRGDHDGSGVVDLTDPLNILFFLFLGQQLPICLDASDGDNSGAVDLSDALNLLQFLFLGGFPLVATLPGPFDCGSDPTVDIDPDGPGGFPNQPATTLGCDMYPSPDFLPAAACP